MEKICNFCNKEIGAYEGKFYDPKEDKFFHLSCHAYKDFIDDNREIVEKYLRKKDGKIPLE
jgi:hypothetical protein